MHFRPATIHDIPKLADLAVQLYNAELPSAFRGDIAKQQALLRFILEADNYAGLRGRYVGIVDEAIIGMANIHLPHDLRLERAPKGTLRQAFAILGIRDGLHLAKTIARSLISTSMQRPANHAYIHGVVVDAPQRGHGYGRLLMNQIEQVAKDRGMEGVCLQVVLGNDGARKLYQSLGYVVIQRTPAWVNRIAFGSETMSKRFLQG